MIKDPKTFLEDIISSIDLIESFTKGISSQEFKQDPKTQDAVIRRFAVIGEAANNIPKEIKEKHKNIEWRGAIRMRNFLLHEYFDIDLDVV